MFLVMQWRASSFVLFISKEESEGEENFGGFGELLLLLVRLLRLLLGGLEEKIGNGPLVVVCCLGFVNMCHAAGSDIALAGIRR